MASLVVKARSLLSPHVRQYVAVSFDSRRLLIVEAETIGRRARILRTMGEAMGDGIDINDAAAVGAFIGGRLAELRLQRRGVLMCVPRGLAVLKPLVLPPNTSPEEMPAMVHFQVEKELPFRPEEAVIDFAVESHLDTAAPASQQQAQGTQVLVAAVRMPVLDYYRRLADAAGVKLLRLGLRPYANVRCYQACNPPTPGPVALVTLYSDEVEIDVLNDRSLVFSRSGVLKLPPLGQTDDDTVSGIAAEVLRSLQSYLSVERGGRIGLVSIAGGTGLEHKLVGELQRRLSIRCELFDPSGSLKLQQCGEGGNFITPLGLAISHGEADALPLDFLSPKRPVVPRDTRKTRRAMTVAASMFLAVGLYGAASLYVGSKEAHARQLANSKNKLDEEKKKLQPIADRVDAIESWRKQGRDWLDHWALLSCLFPSCEQAYISGLTTRADGTMSFTVHARTSDVITQLGQKLTEHGYQLRPGQSRLDRDERLGYVYRTDVQLTVPADMAVALEGLFGAPRPADDISAQPPAPRGRAQPAAAALPAPTASGPPPAQAQPSQQPAGASGRPGGASGYRRQVTDDRMRRFDADGDGYLNTEELRRMYSKSGGRRRGGEGR